jgi:hypothetical protein
MPETASRQPDNVRRKWLACGSTMINTGLMPLLERTGAVIDRVGRPADLAGYARDAARWDGRLLSAFVYPPPDPKGPHMPIPHVPPSHPDAASPDGIPLWAFLLVVALAMFITAVISVITTARILIHRSTNDRAQVANGGTVTA